MVAARRARAEARTAWARVGLTDAVTLADAMPGVGLKRAKAEAIKLGGLIACGEFNWAVYEKNEKIKQNRKNLIAIGESHNATLYTDRKIASTAAAPSGAVHGDKVNRTKTTPWLDDRGVVFSIPGSGTF